MSKIKVLYNEYVEHEYQPTQALEKLKAHLSTAISQKAYAGMEDIMNLAMDKETEAAFTAGFRTALALIGEAFHGEGRAFHAGI